MSTNLNRKTTSSGLKRILVIAHPELSAAIYEALDPYIEPPVKGSFPADVTVDGNTHTVEWLCQHIFPSPLKAGVLTKTWMAARRWVQVAVSATDPAGGDSTGSPMSLFGWGDYDFVIIQDLWRAGSGLEQTIECAGYVLANLDYYLWGNFSTKKIILVTDKTFPWRKAELIRESLANPSANYSLDDVMSAFDRKEAFELVELGTAGSLRQRLLRLLKSGENPNPPPVEPAGIGGRVDGDERNETSQIVDRLLTPVMREVGKSLQSYVGQQAEVLIVDDELRDLEATFEQLTGRPLEPPANLSPNWVNVTSAADGIVRQAETFEDLVDLCLNKFQESARGRKPYTLLVTDILFRGPSWNKTGLDLIETLRLKLKEQEKARRIGIVAYTAFTTPFIAMSSHQRGADFVVPKTDFGRHDLRVKGSQRLMMTLAFLCFQKSFLSDKRKEAGEIKKTARSGKSFGLTQRSLRQLQAVLPRHAVSLHLQQEWLDTCYLFEAISVYDSGSEQLDEIYKEVSRKYDGL